MPHELTRRGFLKALVCLAGAAVLPSVSVELARATIVKPELKEKVAWEPDPRSVAVGNVLRHNTMRRTRTYYVDTHGDDFFNDRSAIYPWRTVEKAAKAAGSGDTIYVRGGIYEQQRCQLS